MTLRAIMPHLRRPALVLLALNAAVFVAFSLPRTLQERSLASRLALLRAEAERERGQVAALRERAQATRANTRDAERFSREVLKTRQATLLPALAEIHEAAEAEGIELGREDYHKADVKGSPFTRVTIRLPVSGTYRELVGFLGRLERAGHLVVVDEIQLRERGDGAAADLDVVLSTYFREEPGADGA